MNKKTILFFICLQWVATISYAQWDSVGHNHKDRGKYVRNTYVDALCTYRGNLIMGGDFDTVGNRIPAPGLAQWDGTQWDSINAGVMDPAALLVYKGNLVALGYYPPQYSFIGQWNGSEWDSVGPVLRNNSQWGPYLTALGEYNGNLYIASEGLIAYNLFNDDILKLDSGKWDTIPYASSLAIDAMAVYQGKLYLGGTFNVNGIHNIAAWNDTILGPVGAGINSSGVGGLFVWNGKLYASGLFDSAGGRPARNIAVWDGHAWSPLGKGINVGVGSFAIYHDTLIVGGSFDSAGGILCNNLAKWDGTNWSALGSGVFIHTKGRARESGIVNALCVYNGALYVGGEFDSAGGIYAINIARWGTPNSTDTAIYTGPLKIYPNPSKGIFTLVIGSEAKQSLSTIEIYNLLGQNICTANLSPGLNEINLTGKASGIYIYKVTSANGNKIQGKLVIAR